MTAFRNIINGSLKSKLIELIRLRGPMTVADYTKIVLTNPESGFYMNQDVFGAKGHFTTNPEISQMFGEVLGVWILQEWLRFKCPKPLRLVEFGPGRGTLMSDITRTLKAFKQTHDNIQIQLVELSPYLKEVQRKTLGLDPSLTGRIEWHSSVDSLEKNQDGFTAFVAHEFLDALPVYKFVRDQKSNCWRDLLIDYDERGNLIYCISKQPSLSARLLIPKGFNGDHLEVCPDAALHLEKVASRLNNSGKGCMLICDYGFENEPDDELTKNLSLTSLEPIKSSRDTFRAYKNHKPCCPLEEPGQADLTADVDFGYLKQNLRGKAKVFGSVKQKNFLLKCGLQKRLDNLLNNSQTHEREDLISGAKMLINEMGQRYRFLAFFPKETESLFERDPPAGFDEDQPY